MKKGYLRLKVTKRVERYYSFKNHSLGEEAQAERAPSQAFVEICKILYTSYCHTSFLVLK